MFVNVSVTQLQYHSLTHWSNSMTTTTYRPIYEIAREIRKDWGIKVNYAAKPYPEAMECLSTINGMYEFESADMIVRYFLCNASTWRGDTAKRVKAELKAMLK